MSYRIEYQPMKWPGSRERGSLRRAALTGVFFLLYLLLVDAFWPQGRELLRELLIPGDPDVTMEAFGIFAHAIQSGSPFADAAEVFCRTIMGHGAY